MKVAGGKEQAVRRDAGGERDHADEGLVPAGLAPEREHHAAHDVHGPEVVAGEGPAADPGLGVDEVHGQQLVRRSDDGLERDVGLGDDVGGPEGRLRDVHPHHPPERCPVVGVEQRRRRPTRTKWYIAAVASSTRRSGSPSEPAPSSVETG